MISPISTAQEAALFTKLSGDSKAIRQGIMNLKSIGLSQKDVILRTIARNLKSSRPEVVTAVEKFMNELMSGILTKNKFAKITQELNQVIQNSAAMKKTPMGTAIMAEGWQKPIVFENVGDFKFVGFVDNPQKVNHEMLVKAAYNEKPGLVMGGIGNSNIKPEQVIKWPENSKELSKKELSAKYEEEIVKFYDLIIRYLIEADANPKDIIVACAHSYCGIDKALRDVAEKYGMKCMGVTPTEYTQYVKGTEMPPTKEFINGYIKADFPYPTFITRNSGEIEDYATVYGKMVGKGNPIGVFGGGEHAFIRDAKEAFIGAGEGDIIPVDIMKDKCQTIIPAVIKKEDGTEVVTNASRDILERVNSNPYEKYRYAFKYVLPNNSLKQEIAQYEPQAAMATAMYTKLAQAGKIGK